MISFKMKLANNISYSGGSLNVTLMTLHCALITFININICKECNVLVYSMNVWPIQMFRNYLNNLIYIIFVLKMRGNVVDML